MNKVGHVIRLGTVESIQFTQCNANQRIPNPKWVNLVGSPKLLLTYSWLKYSQIKLASLGNPSLPKTLCGWAFGVPRKT